MPSKSPKLLCSLVTWNSRLFLESFFASLAAQTFRSFELVVIDNASTDGTVEKISDFSASWRIQISDFYVLKNDVNRGFAAAHNQAIRLACERGMDAVLVVNPDIVLTPSCIEQLVQELRADPSLGSVGAKVYRMSECAGLTRGKKNATIDSFGMRLTRSRHVLNQGEGKPDHGQYSTKEDVFGISGALALYRCQALQDTAVTVHDHQEFFDENFFSYKEDTDLAWRLQHNGWKARVIPGAIAYHQRTIAKDTARMRRPMIIRTLSHRNHVLMILKNEEWRTLPLFLPFILFREIAKAFFLLVTDPHVFIQSCTQLCSLVPTIIRKRPWVHRQCHRRISPSSS